MWWRAVLATAAVACALPRARAAGLQRSDQRVEKNLLCVLILNRVQKEDLDEKTLHKLRRHNVNIDDLNNEAVRNECEAFKLSKGKRHDAPEGSDGRHNEKNIQNKPLVYFANNNKTNEFEPNKNGFRVVETRNGGIKYDCNKIIKYDSGQPNLNSMMTFWKHCVHVKKPNQQYDYESNLKIKQNNISETVNTSNNTSSKINNYNQTPVEKNNRDIERKQHVVNDSQPVKPPVKYKSNNYMENTLAPRVQHLNQIKEYASNKEISEKPLRPNKSHTSNNGNINYQPEIHGVRFVNRGKESTFRNQFVKEDAISETSPYITNHNVVDVGESLKFIPNIPDNKLFSRGNEPKKYLQTMEPSNMDVIMKIRDGNFFYPINNLSPGSYLRKSIQINDMYENVPKISQNNNWYRENISKKDPRTGLWFNGKELPTFFYTTAEEIKQSKNEPYAFKNEPIQGTYFPNTNAPHKKLFYPVSEPRRFLMRNDSINRVESQPNHASPTLDQELSPNRSASKNESIKEDESNIILSTRNANSASKMLPNSGSDNFSDSKNIHYTRPYTKQVGFEKNKYIRNASSTYHNKLYHPDAVTHVLTFLSEPKRQNHLYKTTYDIAKTNLYRGFNTNVQDVRNNTLGSTNLSDYVPISEYNHNKDSEHNFFLPKKEPVSIDKSVKVYNTQGNLLKQRNPDGVINNISINIPNIVNASPLSGITSNKDLPRENNHKSPKLHKNAIPEGDLYGEIASSTRRRGTANPNITAVKEEPENNVLTDTIPKNIIINIAESIKAMVLKDLKKEFLVPSTTITTTGSTTPTSILTTGDMQNNHTKTQSKLNESAIQLEVMNKVLKMLEQLNIFKNNPLNMSQTMFQTKGMNINTLDNNKKSSTILAKTTSTATTTTPATTGRTVAVDTTTATPTARADRDIRQKYVPAPLMFQTNLLDIPPMSVYMDKYLDPISQNIILTTTTKQVEPNIQSDKRATRANNAPRSLNKIQGKKTKYTNTPQQRPRLAAAVNKSEKSRAAAGAGARAHPRSVASDYYTYSRPVNTESGADTRAPSPAVDRLQCCDRQYVSQLMRDCCNERFASRQQVALDRSTLPLGRARPLSGPGTPGSRIRSLIMSHQKVNSILENILSARNRYVTKFRSVELI